jgi:sigma-B regulation protein RsbU (phosphoserine phosphatase)
MADANPQIPRLTGLYFVNLSANVSGFLIIALLNLFTPLEFFKATRAYIMAGGWVQMVAYYPVIVFIGLSLQYFLQRPISLMLRQMRQGKPVFPIVRYRAQRRLLKLPATIAIVNFVMWISLTAMLVIIFLVVRQVPIRMSIFVAFRGFMIGWIAAALSFFLVETIDRKRLIPLLFPEGKLTSIPVMIRLSILRRIRFLYGAGTTVPMVILVGTLLFVLWEIDGTSISAAQFGKEFLVFTIALCGIFVLIALRLNFLVGSSIVKPIQHMIRLVSKVQEGDFNQKIQVRSSDELGALGDGINEMTDGLLERERMRQSLNLAKEVQQALLPQSIPRINGLDIAAKSIYCDETGGDYFDFINMEAPDSDRIGIVIGDVSGHGVSSALLMATARALLRQRSALSGDVCEIVYDVNCQLTRDVADSGGFMTLFYMAYNQADRSLEWIRAGHDPAIFFDPATHRFAELHGEGMALGIDETCRFEKNRQARLKKGQIIVLGTDGIWEAHNSHGEMFGKDPLYEIIQQNHAACAQEILDSIMDALTRFQKGVAAEDDITIVVMKAID